MTQDASLAELLDDQRTDQRRRWLAGDRVTAESIFARNPRLLADAESALELVYGEILLREGQGEAPDWEEYARRFPALADRLAPLSEVHRALESDRFMNSTRGDSPLAMTNPDGALGPIGPPPVLAGYVLLGELGRGGMGVIYRARQVSLNREVALKMILAGRHAGAAQVARFRTEARAIAQLQHPNIVQIHDVGEHDGQPFLSLELVEGKSLAQELAGVPQTPARAARWVWVLACAIETAHRKAIIHRDLKPSNILLSDDGTLKITDFGLAKSLAVDPELTRSNSIMGSPSYMAPEQAAGPAGKVGPAADIYALGAILYELLTGRPPFRATTVLETLELVRWSEPVAPRQLRPKLPRDIETICLKCLQKEPGRRYRSAEALAQDLHRWLAGEPIAARPVNRLERLWRWSRRNRAVAGLSSAVVLLLIVATVASTLTAIRLDRFARADRQATVRIALAREEAEALAEENRLLLVRQYVAAGSRMVDQGDLSGSLPWFVEALFRDRDDPVRAGDHRIRIAATLDACPRLVDLWNHVGVFSAAYSTDGRSILSAGVDGTIRVWDAETGRQRVTLTHAGGVRDASFSPDGRRIATAGEDGSARIWDAADGTLLGAPLKHGGVVTLAVFSPDGRSLATACDDGTARLWDAATGALRRSLAPHSGTVRHVAYSPDGRLVVTGDDGAAKLWDAATGKPLARLDGGQPVWRTAFSPDGRLLLTASSTNLTRVWDVAAATPLLTLAHDASVWHAAFSPDGRLIATASFDGNARLWDAATGVPATPPLRHDSIVLNVAFSPDGRHLLTAGDDKTARLWDAATGIHRATAWHGGPVQQATFSPDGRRVLTASDDGTARVWDMAVEPPRISLKHDAIVNGADFSPDGRRVATTGYDRSARLWDASTGRVLATLPHDGPVWHAAFSPDGRLVATAADDATARLWDGTTGKPLATLRHGRSVWHAAFSPDGRLLLTTSGHAPSADLALTDRVMQAVRDPAFEDEGEARVWDVAAGSLVATFSHQQMVPHAAFSPDGRRVVTACGDGKARVWDLAATTPARVLVHAGPILHAEYSPDGRRIVTACYDNKARVWNAATGELTATLPHSRALPCATFSPDGLAILTASDDGTARVWSAATGAPLTRPMTHRLPLFHAAFSRDGRHVATAGDDGVARVWEAATGDPVTPRFEHGRPVRQGAFSPDGRRIVTACSDGRARIWSLRPALRPDDELALMAHILSGHRIDDVGGLMPIPLEHLLVEWRELRRRRPRERDRDRDGVGNAP